MTEFTFLFRSRPVPASPEQAQKTVQRWAAWLTELRENGHLKNPGNPLDAGGLVVRGKDRLISDGPFAEAKDIVNGHLSVEAKDAAHAAELAKGCPVLDAGGSVEVRPVRIIAM